MVSWWHRDVIAAGKLPLMLCFVAFVVTFVCIRVITRLIRDGRGPFRNQVTATGTHIHHAVPGLILLIVGAFTAIGGPAGSLGWRSFAGVLVGIGTSLVLDEFALILHLQDDYWSGEGQLSVQAVTLTAACLGLALVGFSPYGVQDVDGIELSLRLSATSVLVIDGVLAVICALKGKYRSALFGLFLPPVAAAGALRLGRPSSIWARHFYHGERLQRATRRAAEFDRRWVPVQTDWDDFIGGRPSSQPPPGTSRRVKRLPARNPVTRTEPSLGRPRRSQDPAGECSRVTPITPQTLRNVPRDPHAKRAGIRAAGRCARPGPRARSTRSRRRREASGGR